MFIIIPRHQKKYIKCQQRKFNGRIHYLCHWSVTRQDLGPYGLSPAINSCVLQCKIASDISWLYSSCSVASCFKPSHDLTKWYILEKSWLIISFRSPAIALGTWDYVNGLGSRNSKRRRVILFNVQASYFL